MKQYNGEKAIISLTSWKARINTVCKTLFSLIDQCPGFHIVLVLSEEEFPKKEDELPENLKIFIDNDLIEVLWVYKNYKSFKKVLFTMDKYRDVPVISADDDCIYTCNYAECFYKLWLKNKTSCISIYNEVLYKNMQHHCGAATLYFPGAFNKFRLEMLTEKIMNTTEDDIFYTVFLNLVGKSNVLLYDKNVMINHDEISPLEAYWRGKTEENLKL